MTIEHIEPKEAYKRMQDTAKPATYLDVRTVGEYEAGHAAGAHNVPVLFRDGGPRPNENFVKEVEQRYKKDSKLVVGCQAGGRSLNACRLLEAAGFTSLANIAGGWGGQIDGSGNVITPGWSMENLPAETGNPQGRGYPGS